MIFHLFDVIVLIGLINSFVFAGVILNKKPWVISNLISASILIVLGLLCLKILFHTVILREFPQLQYFPLGFDLFLQPLLYFYTIVLTESIKFDKRLFIKHSVLPLIFLAYSLLVYLSTFDEATVESKSAIATKLLYDEIKLIEDILSVILGVYYGLLSYIQLKKYQNSIETFYSNTSMPTYNWLRNLLFVTAIVLLFLGLMIASQQFLKPSFVPIELFYFYIVFLIYIFGFFGFKHKDFRVSVELIDKKTKATSNLQFIELINQFDELLKSKKLYLESDLNLNQCAEKLNTNPQILSEAINLSTNKSFREYINHLRVEEFKERIAKADFKKDTIIGIAFECGFNSEASFYRIFKEMVGCTPKEYLKKIISS